MPLNLSSPPRPPQGRLWDLNFLLAPAISRPGKAFESSGTTCQRWSKIGSLD
jgi:hypothetical protein